MNRGARILLFTFGSLGDLHPYMALARGLIARGHHAAIATSPFYRERIESDGIEFLPVRPDHTELFSNPGQAMRRYMDDQRGSERIVRELFMAPIRESYEDTLMAARGADLIVSHPVTFAVPIVGEQLGIRWASSVLAPMSFFSKYDPTVPPNAPWLEALRPLGPGFHSGFKRLVEHVSRGWMEPVRRLRAEVGLPPGGHPLFDGQHSPHLILGLFSPIFGEPQPDWPAVARATGFPFLDHPERDPLPDTLAAFLDSGPPRIVFTLGSSAVWDARDFYEQAVLATTQLGMRAVLLVGRETDNMPRVPLPAGVIAIDYAPYAALFPRAAAIVHQGGIGTTAEALRSGRPMLVMPYSHDQFDNAARAARLGVARRIDRRRFTARQAAREISQLIGEEHYAARAAEIGARVRSEDGVGAACEALETQL